MEILALLRTQPYAASIAIGAVSLLFFFFLRRLATKSSYLPKVSDHSSQHMAASVVDKASSSSCTQSPTPPSFGSWTHHVFLSFRGEDTRKGFLGHLYAALDRKGITTFKDDKILQKGDDIPEELPRAIEESMFAILVLSKNYATSSWCLDELQKIVECSQDKGLVIVPVFYDVEPSDVRHQKGSFEKAFTKHEARFGQQSDKVTKWREALTKVANYSGWNSKDMDEPALVESIAQDIHKKLIPKLPSCTENLIGILSKVEKVYSLLGLGLKDVRFIGICGMGGIGKTTIARAIYEANQGDFEVYCFLASIREGCDKKGIVKIQEDLVKCVNISVGTFHNELDGRRVIQNSLCNKKVLLVIDDVNDASQLENLAGGQNWFGPGSRIIITTRDLHLLESHGVHGSYKVEWLNKNQAMHLFCLKAFKQNQPKEGYLELSKEVVKYCDGLPLALEVLGSYLCGRPIGVWHSGIKKIKSVPHSKILDKLKISYDDLDTMGQHVFLDIACFFKGWVKDKVIDILEKCDNNPQIEIDVLIERSLVTLDEKGLLEMHDLVEEMGKNIVIQESPNDPGKRSRLWSKDDINLVLTKNKGTDAIQAIVFYPYEYGGGCTEDAFSSMGQLKLLKLVGAEVPCKFKSLPSSLKVLQWESCALESLSFTDVHSEIVEIVLKYSNIKQLWHGKKFMEKLKNLELCNCHNLEQLPDFSDIPNLEKLIISSCYDLTEVPLSLICHKNLVVLHLLDCCSLKTFPGKLEMSSLRELILVECFELENLPEFGECMKHLSNLSLYGLPISQLPTSLGCLVGLEELNIEGCHKRVCFPDTIPELKFPLDFCHFPSLTKLNLSDFYFVSLPMSIHEFPKLRQLRLNKCPNLQSLPELPSSIRELDAWGCKALYISESNPLSKACSIFTSPSQDHGQVVLQMLITGRKIPSWFVHQEDGNCISIPLQHDFPQNEKLGIALCFLIQPFTDSFHEFDYDIDLTVHNGTRFITKMVSRLGPYYHLYILYLSNDYFSEEIQLDNKFELSTNEPPEELKILRFDDKIEPSTTYPNDKLKILRSAARWMHKQDVEDLKKIEQSEQNRKSKRKVEYLWENIEEMK